MCSIVHSLTWAAVAVFAVGLHSVQLTAVGNNGSKVFDIYWNSTNPIFRIDKTDNVIDVNKGNMQYEYDRANLICPVYEPGTKDDDMERYIIYNVSKDEYDTCRITNQNPRIIAVCNQPNKLMYFTITFRPFTPQPGGLEFLPGLDYYFISTSTKDDLHRRFNGRCHTDNMKITFKVWKTPQEQVTQPLTPGTTQKPAWYPSVPKVVTTPTTTATTTSSPSTSRPTKKSKTYGKNQNEVVKSEELTGSAPQTFAMTALVAIVSAVLPMWVIIR